MSRPLKILLAEDDPNDAEMALLELRSAGFEPDWRRVETEAAFLEHLHGGLDLVLSDFRMPQFNGMRALELVQQSGLEIPFILLSGTIGEDIAVLAIKNGATDYLLKDRLARLGAAVTHALEETRLKRERRQAVATSQRHLSELRVLFDLMPAMIWFKDTENRILRVNQRVADAAGKSVEEIEGRPALEIYPQEAAKFHADDLAVIHAGAPKLGIVETMRGPDGGKLWVQTDKVPVRDKDGKTIGIVVMAQDITERKQAEVARLASEERFRSYFELGLIGMAITSPAKGFLEANYELCRILGYGREELWEKTWADLTHPDDLAGELIKFERVVAGKMDGYAMEKRFLRKDGEVVHALIAVKAARREDGSLNHIIGLLQDITERKKAEDALRESEQRFKALFDQAAVGVALADVATGRFVHVNQRFADIVGRARGEMEQLTFAAITHPKDVVRDRETTQQLQAGTIREFSREKRYLRKDRSEVWVNLTVSAMWTSSEPPGLCVAVVQDITERKQLEEQLQQTQKMEAVGTLAGGIAHDFNNILAAMNGYTELARGALPENSVVSGYLAAVLKASGRATDLIRQILTFSRQQPVVRRPIPLLPVVTETVNLLRATLPSTIEFDVSLAADTPTVFADATQIHQILMNLGTNAWHAMKDRSGRLQVKLERIVVDAALAATMPRIQPGLFARVSVADTGSGMDAATLRRVFEPFFTTKPLGEGTGLGLAVVHGIINSHDGAITVESEPGKGTEFRVYLPAHAGEVAATAGGESAVPRGAGERILVIDDEPVLARLVLLTLSALGYEVEFATLPAVALTRVQNDPQRFALVITDQTMPGMTGILLATRLHEIRHDLPIILMTGYTASFTGEQAEAAGIQQVLQKPATLHALGTAVRAALRSRPDAKNTGPVLVEAGT